MDSLFSLTAQYNELYDMLTDESVDEEVVSDTLDGILGEIEVKSEGYVAVINRLDMELDACEKQTKMWEQRYNTRKNAIDRLKKALVNAMMQMDKTEIKAGDNTIKLVNNGGVIPIKYKSGSLSGLSSKEVKIEDIPKEYRRTVVTETVDGEKVRKALESGEKLDFAYIGERSRRIVIK